MSQLTALISTLKKELKAKGKTYDDVARHMQLSEASIKRMFATQHFTLDRLEMICHWVGLEISDLVNLMNESQHKITQLTEDQEQELANNEKLMLVAVCARNFWTVNDITSHYEISETECIKLLAILDRLKLIELMPGNRIKLRIHPDFRWLKNGPIEHYFRTSIEKEFFNSKFGENHEIRLFLSGMISDHTIEQLHKRINQLAKEFSEQHFEERIVPINEKTNVGLVLAMRPWELSAFNRLRRK